MPAFYYFYIILTLQKKIYPADELGIKSEDFDLAALTITEAIQQAGHEAYLVGGCIRDLLAGKKPKDFDIATNAKPEQVKTIFGRKAQLIGRRFKIVHVHWQKQVFEITTFRADPKPGERGDNTFGSLDDDASRRDLTLNALYYCPKNHQVIDFYQGIEAIKDKRIEMIGDIEERIDEDAVRMLRAIRFRQQLGFTLEADLELAIRQYIHRLGLINSSRLTLEVNKLFLKGYGQPNLLGLIEFEALDCLFPTCDTVPEPVLGFWKQAMQNSDNRVQEGKPVITAFVFAVILWPSFITALLQEEKLDYDALGQLMDELLLVQNDRTQLNRFQKTAIKDIWYMQFRLGNLRAKNVEKMISHAKFRAAYDFLCLREQSGLINWEQQKISQEGLAKWWTEYQEQNPMPTRSSYSRKRNSYRKTS